MNHTVLHSFGTVQLSELIRDGGGENHLERLEGRRGKAERTRGGGMERKVKQMQFLVLIKLKYQCSNSVGQKR